MKKFFIAAIRGYILNGANNYEILGCFESELLTWHRIELIRKEVNEKIKADSKVIKAGTISF